MDLLLSSFIRALRNADVRISTAETLDALSTVELVGYADRSLLKSSLSLVLPKTVPEKAIFDATFDQFFAYRKATPIAPDASSSQSEPADFGQQGGQGSGEGGSGAPQNQGQSTSTRDEASAAETSAGEMAGAQSALGQLLMRGNQIEIDIAINAAGARVNVQQIEVFTQKGLYAWRILDAMGQQALQQEIDQLNGNAEVPSRRLGQELGRRRAWLREQVRDYVERQFLLNADVTGKRLRGDLLRNMRIGRIDATHHKAVQELVRRMARRLVSAYSRRRKVFRRGQLHVPRTLRRNMKYDDAIFDLHWRSQKVDRPKVFAICDVSGSVASYAGFMLMFLYSLDEVLPKVRSFAFSSDLGEVSELFGQHDAEEAIALTLKQYGGGSTDYAQAFSDLRRLCLDDIDKRSTVIVLGDARNNNADARGDILKEVYDRCRRLIWLNPEPRSMWNTGDSEMRFLAPYCHQVEECGTPAQLERVVSRLLRATR
ncbi:hypothetical protein HNQ60_003552 [Povalibacter uvarum]|uniref:VWA containing CoxE family protein n=1 Tax=Povalibacter uvarum TaxID=732238 RepID=A0A841HS03_9GAMM|nr:VWA domain-containing protein [Povalibacter uvarum]MBB6094665.1 hypothetical protein [Povalibacter uvarum]